MNPYLLGGILLVLLVGGFIYTGQTDEETVTATFPGTAAPPVTLTVADEEDEQRTGLMNRTDLCDTCGMLFVFDTAAPRTFWMKHTRIPLDIIFLSSGKQVLNVAPADPPAPGTPDGQLQRYHSAGPAQYVIELPQGYAAEHGVTPGTMVQFQPPRP